VLGTTILIGAGFSVMILPATIAASATNHIGAGHSRREAALHGYHVALLVADQRLHAVGWVELHRAGL
jgi:hypothetical protein